MLPGSPMLVVRGETPEYPIAYLDDEGRALLLARIHKTALEALLDRSPLSLDCSIRLQNVCRRHGLTTIRDLVRLTPKQVATLAGCGQKVREEVRMLLREHLGLALPSWDEMAVRPYSLSGLRSP